ncbi:MAG TPA: BON domain-containing protein [Rhodocyclaceae bacterium]|nr:BON domain-containing protein [Rhodocyclaceae bacterium]
MRLARSFLAAAMLTAAVAAGAADTGRETTGQTIDDATITTKVKSAFVKDPVVSALGVKVETYRGTVQLGGFADSQAEIKRAETLARSVPGVADVKNDIQLKPAKRE